ncbi:MAG: glycosyltransferase family 4 protein [Bacteroidales bacterium]
MKRTRIGFLITSASWNNFQRWHYYTSLALYERGYDVVLIAPGKHRIFTRLKTKKVKVVPYNRTGFFLYDIMRLAFILRKNFVNTLFFNYPNDLAVVGFTKMLSPVSKIYFRKGTVPGIKSNHLNRLIFNRFITGIITNSKANREEILTEKRNTVKTPNIEVIYQGLHLDRYKRVNGNWPKGKDEKKLRIGIYNSAFYRDNLCIELLRHLKEYFDSSNVKFIVYQDTLSPEFRRILRKNDLTQFVSFDMIGRSLKEFLASVDVYISPDISNAFNYSLLYAMVMRKPVIAVSQGSNKEIIEHGKNGFLIDKENLDILGQFIEKLKDKKFRETMGEQSMQNVKKNFNFEQTVDKLETIL